MNLSILVDIINGNGPCDLHTAYDQYGDWVVTCLAKVACPLREDYCMFKIKLTEEQNVAIDAHLDLLKNAAKQMLKKNI
jgi:hypothetical protein